jgi:O-antigen ligase
VATVALMVVLVTGVNPAPGIFNPQDALKRITALGNSGTAPVYLRAQVYHTAPRIIWDHPIFGVGAVQFPAVAPKYGLTDPSFSEPKYGNPHDVYLHIATTLGLFGFGALVWLAVAIARSLGIACRRLRGQTQAMAFALAGTFLGIGLTGLTNDFINSDPIVGTLFVLMGCVSVLRVLALSAARAPTTEGVDPGVSQANGSGLRPIPIRAPSGAA